MAAPQHAFLRILRHVRDLALVFTWRAHVDQRFAAFALRQRFIEESTNLFVESFLRHRIICLWILGNFARHGAAFGFPFVPTAIENFQLLMSKHPESPECVAGPPVGFITIKNAGCVWRDLVMTATLRKFL